MPRSRRKTTTLEVVRANFDEECMVVFRDTLDVTLMMVVRVKLRRTAMALIMVTVDEDAVEEVDVVGPILVGRGKIRPFLREHLKNLLRRKTRPLPLRLLSTTNPNSQLYRTMRKTALPKPNRNQWITNWIGQHPP